MATALQQQLAVIAANSTHQLDLKAQRARHSKSLLFEPRDAASQSFDTIYQICYEGFEELCALDSRFTTFARNVFSEQSKNEDRTHMTKKENEELDDVLESFLGLVGGRLLLKPAMKAIEWLVRRFRVQEYNTECVLLTFLPYHTSHIFPTLLSILPDQLPPSFRFLQPYKASLQSPPRNAILSAAVGNQNFFSAFNNYVLKIASMKHHSAILLGFWASMTAQAVNGMIESSRSGRDSIRRQREEDLLLRVLPILKSALGVTGIPELFLGACMIITILASKASLEERALDAMMEAVAGSWTEDTLAEGMMCLAVVAEEKQQPSLPITVAKAVAQAGQAFKQLFSLAGSQRASKLVTGVTLGCVQLAYKKQDISYLSKVKEALDAEILAESQVTLILRKLMHTLIRLRKSNNQGDAEQTISQILMGFTEEPEELILLQQAAQAEKTTLSTLQLMPLDIRDGDAVDIDPLASLEAELVPPEIDSQDPFEVLLQTLPSLPGGETSFLDINFDLNTFRQYSEVFHGCLSSKTRLEQFLAQPQLHMDEPLSRPELLSFLMRIWSSNSTTMAKITALNTAHAALSGLLELPTAVFDLQILLPYVLAALSEPMSKVRQAAAELSNTIYTLHDRTRHESKIEIMHFYGPALTNTYHLHQHDTTKFLKDILRSALDDSMLDKDYLKYLIVDAIDGKREEAAGALAKSLRVSLCSFLASHLVVPVFRVKLVLLQVLAQVGKSGAQARSQFVLPFARQYFQVPRETLLTNLSAENIPIFEMDNAVLGSLTHRSAEEIQLVKEITAGTAEYVPRAFDRISQLFPAAKGSQIDMADWLLDLTLDPSGAHSKQNKDEALQTLRSLSLPGETLVYLLEALPKAVDLQEQPMSKKRRMSGNDGSQLRDIDYAKSQATLRRVTLVLDLIEMNGPEKYPQLLRGLFQCLSELHHFKTRLGSELVYTFQVLLGCILAVVDGLQNNPEAEVDRTVIRTDLIVECVRTTSSTQIHNTALLLVSSLASWAPELVLHCVMPLFTFMSTTLLRQSDSFSAHVTDQTVERIMPPLAASLKKKGKNLVVGASELLLSFTAAFEHIPLHRRAGLFKHLVQTLGPEESLFAVVAMLVERYGSDSNVYHFVSDLMNQFSAVTEIKAAKQYLDLISDSLKPKRSLSDVLLSFGDKDISEKLNSQQTLIGGLASLLRTAMLRERLAIELVQSNGDSKTIQTIYASLLEQTMQLNRERGSEVALQAHSNALLLSVLGLMPTKNFIESSAELMQIGSDETRQQVFRALEARVSKAKAGDANTRQIFLNVLPNCAVFLRADQPIATRHAAISCTDQICEKYGKTDRDTVLPVAKQVAGEFALGSEDPSLRVISILCLASVVEILRDDCIPILPDVLALTLSYLKDDLDRGGNKTTEIQAAGFSLLNAVLDHLPWMLADQYLDQALLLADEAAFSGRPNDALHEFGDLVASKVGAAQLLSAVQRTFSKVPMGHIQGVRYHLHVFHLAIQYHNKATITQNARGIFNILLEAFDLRQNQYIHQNEDIHWSEIFDLVDKIALDVTLKLNDATFRPFFIILVEWATTDSGNIRTANRGLSRLVSLYRFSLALFEQLKSIVTGYTSFILQNASELLAHPQMGPHEDMKLLDIVLRTLSSSFDHDQDEYWQTPAHFDAVALPLINQLQQSKAQLTDQVIATITNLAAAARSQEHLKVMNTAIMSHMRSREATVRLAAVKTQRSLTERLAVDWLDLLPEMLPIISELHEDDDEEVERETLRWAREIEEITGENLDPMLA